MTARGYLLRVGLTAFVLVGGTRYAPAQTLHAILVADTQDPTLSTACQRDVATMRQRVARIAAATGYPLREWVLTGPNFSPERLDAVLRDLDIAPDDVLFFYYTGHGYHASPRAGQFPVLLLEKNRARSEQNPALQRVHETLRAKKPRLCVTLGDCCNHVVRNLRGVTKKAPPRAQSEEALVAAYRALFVDAAGDVLIASSQPPESASAHPDSGSFYTRSFDEALELAGNSPPTATWAGVLRAAQSRLVRYPATQRKQSIYELNVTDAAPETALTVTLRTDRGRLNARYGAGDTLRIEVKANRPCHLRLLNLLPDGTMTLLETDFEIRPGQENQYVRLAPGDEFVAGPMSGVEYLLAFATEGPFCPLPTEPNPKAYLRDDGTAVVLVGTLADILEIVTCTPEARNVVRDQVPLTMRGTNRR
jgi:hypothetical protein